MKLPSDSLIAGKKLTNYLLRQRIEDDKSQFLGRAGYTLETAEQFDRVTQTGPVLSLVWTG